jgi:hypothetical protein
MTMTTMRRSILLVLLLLAGTACSTPAPRVPFQYGDGWHVAAIAGGRAMDDRYFNGQPFMGLEVTSHPPGTYGWGWEASLRFATDEGQDFERIRNPAGGKVNVYTFRETDFWELTVGARQTFLPDSALQPFFSVGLSFFELKTFDQLDVHNVPTTPAPAPASEEHFQDNFLGLYLRSGVIWNVLRNTIRDENEFILGADVRALFGVDYSFVEFALSVGYGR